MHKGFKCHNSYVDTWLKLGVLQGSLSNYQPVLKRAWPQYDDKLLVISMHLEQDECISGYPAFLLVARDGSGKAKQVSDVDFKICNATFDQVRKLRAAGHPKRKFPAYPRPQPQN